MATSTEIIAEYAALLPLWLSHLDVAEAAQRQLLTEMQAQFEEEGVIVEEVGVAGTAVADGSAAADTSVWQAPPDDAPAAEEEIDPVAWLSGAATNPPEEGTTPSVEGLGFAAPPSAPSVAPMAAVPAPTDIEDEADMASMFDLPPANDNPILDDSSLGVGPRGNEETNLFAARGDDKSVASMFEQNFGETHTDFLHALREVDEDSLPWDLRETMRYATTQEEIAAAFVKVQRDGKLREFVHLDEALREVTELDYYFRDAAERYDTPDEGDEGDDPILPLY